MSTLTLSEQARLDQLEGIIEAGLQEYLRVGTALIEIRESRLYRVRFGTFEEYVKKRWSFGLRRAEQVMEAAGIAQEMRTIGSGQIPENERQARALAGLPAQEAAEVYAEAAAVAEGHPSAAVIQEIRNRALSGLSTEDQKDVLEGPLDDPLAAVQEAEAEILERGGLHEEQVEADARKKHLDKARWHLRNARRHILAAGGGDAGAEKTDAVLKWIDEAE